MMHCTYSTTCPLQAALSQRVKIIIMYVERQLPVKYVVRENGVLQCKV
jgi:hypothetical protein